MIYVLYRLDRNGPGVGGPFPQVTPDGTYFTNPEDAWHAFVKYNNDHNIPLESYFDGEDLGMVNDNLINGFDVQNDDLYWNMLILSSEPPQ